LPLQTSLTWTSAPMQFFKQTLIEITGFFLVILLILLPGVVTASELQTATKKLALKVAQQATTGSAGSDFLYELRNSGSGPLYGELLTLTQEGAKTGIRKAISSGSGSAIVSAAKIKVFRDKIAKITQGIGRLLALSDVANKLAAGDTKAAAWSAGFTVLGELLARDSVAKALGMASTAPISAAILAAQIYKASIDAKDNAIMSTGIESVKGTIATLTRDRGRTLGARPGPFPASAENLEKIWQRILHDTTFRTNFGNYVVQDFSGEWPTAGFFARMDAQYQGLANSNQELQDALQAEIQEHKANINLYSASLLAILNRSALHEEKRIIANRKLRELKAYFDRQGSSLQAGLQNMEAASKRLPEVSRFADRCAADIRRTLEDESLYMLTVLRSRIVNYVRDVLRWLPPQGADAGVDQVFAKLAAGHQQVNAAIDTLKQKLAAAVKSPQPTFTEATDATSYYRNYFKATVKAFNWAGAGGPQTAIEKMAGVLADGQFRTSFDKATLPQGRIDYAGSIIQAWEMENYIVACSGGTDKGIDPPEESETISGFYQQANDKIEEIYYGGPAGGDINEGWESARMMALNSIDNLKQLSKVESKETAEALRNMLSVYGIEAEKVYQRAKDIDYKFSRLGSQAFSLAYLGYDRTNDGFLKDKDKLPLTNQKNTIDAPGMQILLEKQFSGYQLKPIKPLMGWLTSAFRDYADGVARKNDMAIRTLRTKFTSGVDAIYATCDAIQENIKTWDSLVAETQANLDDIRLFVDPDFMDSKPYLSWVEKRNAAPGWIEHNRKQADLLATKIQEYTSERLAATSYIRTISKNLTDWFEAGEKMQVMSTTGGPGFFMTLHTGHRDGDPLPIRLGNPYPHYMVEEERNQALDRLQGLWESGGLARFSDSYALWLEEFVNPYFKELKQLPVAREGNFLINGSMGGYSERAITVSSIKKSKAVVNNMTPGSDEFMEQYYSILKIQPMAISFPGDQNKEHFYDLSPESLKAPLAPEYVKIRETLRKKLQQHYTLIEQQIAKQQQEQRDRAQQLLPGLLKELRELVGNGHKKVVSAKDFSGRGAQLMALIDDLEKTRNTLFDEPYRTINKLSSSISVDDRNGPLGAEIGALFKELNTLSSDLANLIVTLQNLKTDAATEIRTFYEQFSKDYEEKNEGLLLSHLNDDWEAGDGTTLYDVEDYFRNMFSVFDEIQVELSGLTTKPLGDEHYQVSYEMLITGRIFADDIEHKEKSSVSEEVEISPSGVIKITRTQQGRFWYIK